MHIKFPLEHMRFDPSPIVSCLTSLPKPAVMQFVAVMSRWLEESGASWCADRLKTLRQRAIAVRAKQDIPPIHWFRLTNAKKLAGSLSFIDSVSERGSNPQFRELIQLLSIYTAFKLPDRASEADFAKQYDAMCHEGKSDTYPTIPNRILAPRRGSEATRSRVPTEKWRLEGWFKNLFRDSWWDVALQNVKKDRLAIIDPPGILTDWKLNDCDVQHALWLLSEESIWNRRNVPTRQLFKESSLYDPRKAPFASFLKGAYGVEMPRRHEVPKGMGSLRYRVQPNGKVRFYAAPHLVVQALLKPLGDLIYDLLASCEWDCTFDQRKGVNKVQQWLRDNRECSSIDLTSATDVFPLRFQTETLLKMVTLFQGETHIYITQLQEYLELFTFISRGEWLLPDDMCDALGKSRGTTGRWKTGQPLGTYPSFGIFAIGHAMLALRACLEVGVPAVEARDTFVILGDDIVISNPKVAERYLEILDTLGVPISRHKSVFRSRSLAEFAGMLVTRTEAFYKPKYLPVTDKTVISLVDTFGPKVVRCYNQFQRALVSLPRNLGRDLNPSGFPLELRYEWATRLESSEIDKRQVVGPGDALRRKIKVDSVSDRPDLNEYDELPRIIGYAGLTPGPADDVFFQKTHELRRLWRSLPPYINPKSRFRYSYYSPSSWTRKARAVIPV